MKNLYLILLVMVFTLSCTQKNSKEIPVIPKPASVEPGSGFFRMDNGTTLVTISSGEKVKEAARIFLEDLKKNQGLSLKTEEMTGKPGTGAIILELNDPQVPDDESYILEAGKRNISIRSGSPAGLFYGLMTLEQLILTSDAEKGTIAIPAMTIKDSPRFAWRGMHLDAGRHFMPLEDVKKYIDYLALYKFNHFHWHLTDDQGWRLEIKKYPKLTAIGAWRDSTMIGKFSDKPRKYDHERYGGFYTQEEARELVRYAAGRFITVIPEIEMPGHAQAAIAAYPELGVTGKEVKVKTEWGISPFIFMPSEKTYGFLEDVLSEVMDIFPSKYIHIGGDEAIKDQWEKSPRVQAEIRRLGLKDEHEMQSYFIHRIEKFLNAKGRKIIGWDEILEGGLAPNATLMSWRGEKGGIAAAKLKHDVIMSPTNYCYFDYYQAKPVEDEPLAIGGYLPLDTVYSYDPVPAELSADEEKYIIGVQANVWTEYIPDFRQVEYMIFPRMLAMSEIAWTKPGEKDMDDFNMRVTQQVPVLEKLGVNYSKTGMPEKAD